MCLLCYCFLGIHKHATVLMAHGMCDCFYDGRERTLLALTTKLIAGNLFGVATALGPDVPPYTALRQATGQLAYQRDSQHRASRKERQDNAKARQDDAQRQGSPTPTVGTWYAPSPTAGTSSPELRAQAAHGPLFSQTSPQQQDAAPEQLQGEESAQLQGVESGLPAPHLPVARNSSVGSPARPNSPGHQDCGQ